MKKMYFTVTGLIGVAILATTILIGSNQTSIITQGTSIYSLFLEDKGNQLTNSSVFIYGESSVTTSMGNSIDFQFNSLSTTDGIWQNVSDGGSFTNLDPISGLQSMNMEFSEVNSQIKVYYSYTTTFNEVDVATIEATSTSYNFDFDGAKPNYLKVVAVGEVSFVSIALNYSCIDFGATLPSKGSTYEFGKYPQTIVSDTTTIDALNLISEVNTSGYIEYNGEEYKKIVAELHVSGFGFAPFSNGSTPVNGETYYFLVEPITWDVLDVVGKKAFMISDVVLGSMSYSTYTDSSYENSDMRDWLINDFYNNNFTSDEQSSMISTVLDDNANTNDKIFLPSYEDMLNSNYGFNGYKENADPARRREATDYAIATDTFVPWNIGAEDDGHGAYYTRTPYSVGGMNIVYFDGKFTTTPIGANHHNHGIAPAMYINF